MKPLRTFAQLRATQPKDSNVREFIISTETEDRHGTIIKMSGWDLTNYRKNPVVMYAHAANRKPDPDLVIGNGTIRFEEGQMIGAIEFDVDGEGVLENTLAKKVLYKIDNGFLNATSVGFQPHEWRMGDKEQGEDPEVFHFVKQELLEFSVVPVPSNPDAVKKEWETWVDETIKEIKAAQSGSENEETDDLEARKLALRIRANSLTRKLKRHDTFRVAS